MTPCPGSYQDIRQRVDLPTGRDNLVFMFSVFDDGEANLNDLREQGDARHFPLQVMDVVRGDYECRVCGDSFVTWSEVTKHWGES